MPTVENYIWYIRKSYGHYLSENPRPDCFYHGSSDLGALGICPHFSQIYGPFAANRVAIFCVWRCPLMYAHPYTFEVLQISFLLQHAFSFCSLYYCTCIIAERLWPSVGSSSNFLDNAEFPYVHSSLSSDFFLPPHNPTHCQVLMIYEGKTAFMEVLPFWLRLELQYMFLIVVFIGKKWTECIDIGNKGRG